jgi:hypothetical protein
MSDLFNNIDLSFTIPNYQVDDIVIYQNKFYSLPDQFQTCLILEASDPIYKLRSLSGVIFSIRLDEYRIFNASEIDKIQFLLSCEDIFQPLAK